MNLHKFNTFQNTLNVYEVYYIFNDWLGNTLSLIGCYVTHSQRQLMNSYLIHTFAEIGFLSKKWYTTCINYDLWLNIMLNSRRTVSRYLDTCKSMPFAYISLTLDPIMLCKGNNYRPKSNFSSIFFLLLRSLPVEFNVKITPIKWSSTAHEI